MVSLNLEDKIVETIFLQEFHSDKKKFFDFIKSSFEKLKNSQQNTIDDNFTNLQIDSMATTWDNNQDRIWDEL